MRTPEKLKKRAITSLVLIAAMLGILSGDRGSEPQTYFLLGTILVLQALAVIELCTLLPRTQPRKVELIAGVVAITLAHFATHSFLFGLEKINTNSNLYLSAATLLIIFSMLGIEMLRYAGDGQSTTRVAESVLVVVYIGVLPSFLLLIRMLPHEGTHALAATIFVPKLGDVAAYLAGSLIGKHRMTPTLSPKKTWEGFAGGMLMSVLTAVVINQIGEPLFKHGLLQAVAFGLIVGLAGVFGDLFESMIKRDAQTKDASQTVPGFGGVLDVVDSVLFAAPVAYFFLLWWR